MFTKVKAHESLKVEATVRCFMNVTKAVVFMRRNMRNNC